MQTGSRQNPMAESDGGGASIRSIKTVTESQSCKAQSSCPVDRSSRGHAVETGCLFSLSLFLSLSLDLSLLCPLPSSTVPLPVSLPPTPNIAILTSASHTTPPIKAQDSDLPLSVTLPDAARRSQSRLQLCLSTSWLSYYCSNLRHRGAASVVPALPEPEPQRDTPQLPEKNPLALAAVENPSIIPQTRTLSRLRPYCQLLVCFHRRSCSPGTLDGRHRLVRSVPSSKHRRRHLCRFPLDLCETAHCWHYCSSNLEKKLWSSALQQSLVEWYFLPPQPPNYFLPVGLAGPVLLRKPA
ncbi:hypothetical protein K402DRAFT_266578 [Aulographum hederae CBS 113979]|uniref:Uncharacterized protein n=1 Tax=Aulographum hederae CBS 113979 TaxID=1176131 RepID=A0A6G1GIM0_9PEZI|nr:hypothetical protein K402DRAFT_266578 [Aulographum hederae CBS 113979]